MQLNLSNLNALVCGASQGIARDVARLLSEAGAKPILVARNENALKQAVIEIPNSRYVCADFKDSNSVEELIKTIKAWNLKINILVNNAGGPPPASCMHAEAQDFQAAMQQHLITANRLAQAFVPDMQEAGYGRIVNIISISGKQPIKDLVVSNATRAAMIAWAKSLSNELAPLGITVNNVLPGYTSTERLKSLIESNAQRSWQTSSQVEEKLKSIIPMGRFASPEEIANAVLFYASPMATYITGTSLNVDGGLIPTI